MSNLILLRGLLQDTCKNSNQRLSVSQILLRRQILDDYRKTNAAQNIEKFCFAHESSLECNTKKNNNNIARITQLTGTVHTVLLSSIIPPYRLYSDQQ